MSDIFDHRCDAFESMERDDYDDTGDGGDLFSAWFESRQRRPQGAGVCPVCGGHTHLVRKGCFGPFWGCNKFPACKGTRDASVADKAMVQDDNRLLAEALAKTAQRRDQTQTQARKG